MILSSLALPSLSLAAYGRTLSVTSSLSCRSAFCPRNRCPRRSFTLPSESGSSVIENILQSRSRSRPARTVVAAN
uniref:Putative secreted protein n=1 Tax=Anopheles triannulatus TaxID=58253 RepID=A0A2M4B7B7_9DIPT